MEDKEIIDLFWSRTDTAISAVNEKYHAYCLHIAYRILENKEDAEECVNDTWFKVWKAIPPQKPGNLTAFLGKIIRNTSLNYLRDKSRKCRGGGQLDLVLEELAECTANEHSVEQEIIEKELTKAINDFKIKPARHTISLRLVNSPSEICIRRMAFKRILIYTSAS